MQCEDSVLTRLQAVWQRQLTGSVDLLAQSIDHGVANEVDFLASYTLIPQILDGQSIGCEQQVRNGVGAEAVNLLWHRHVPRAQSGFDVSDFDTEFLGRYRTRHR